MWILHVLWGWFLFDLLKLIPIFLSRFSVDNYFVYYTVGMKTFFWIIIIVLKFKIHILIQVVFRTWNFGFFAWTAQSPSRNIAISTCCIFNQEVNRPYFVIFKFLLFKGINLIFFFHGFDFQKHVLFFFLFLHFWPFLWKIYFFRVFLLCSRNKLIKRI